jgi:hypothetical protein
MLLFIALFALGIALALWSLRRYPEIDKPRIFAAVASCVGAFSILLFNGPTSRGGFYMAVVTIAMASTLLLMAMLRPRRQ